MRADSDTISTPQTAAATGHVGATRGTAVVLGVATTDTEVLSEIEQVGCFAHAVRVTPAGRGAVSTKLADPLQAAANAGRASEDAQTRHRCLEDPAIGGIDPHFFQTDVLSCLGIVKPLTVPVGAVALNTSISRHGRSGRGRSLLPHQHSRWLPEC